MGSSAVNNIPSVVINLAESDSDDSEFEFVDELDSFIQTDITDILWRINHSA